MLFFWSFHFFFYTHVSTSFLFNYLSFFSPLLTPFFQFLPDSPICLNVFSRPFQNFSLFFFHLYVITFLPFFIPYPRLLSLSPQLQFPFLLSLFSPDTLKQSRPLTHYRKRKRSKARRQHTKKTKTQRH